MKFVDRQKELTVLEKEFNRKEASLVIVYGRRRVGKTALLKEFIKDKRALYFLATEESETMNRQAFQQVAADFLDYDLLQSAQILRWEPIFKALAQEAAHQRIVLVIDEFQYIGKNNPAFLSVFQRIWDTLLSQSNIMVVLCGSLVSMMMSQTLRYDSPLYGRRTAQLKVRPIAFSYYHEFFNTPLAKDELIERYSITGGIPKYIEAFSTTGDIQTALENNLLNPSAFLFDEPNFLLQKEVSEIGSYFSILRVIADGNHKISKIAAVLQQKQSNLPRYLNVLIDLDILAREVPVTEAHPEKSKRGLYQIRDHFIRFWFRYVYPFKGELELDNQQIVLDEMGKDFKQKFVAFAYESICRNIFAELCRKGQIDFAPSRIGSYWRNDNEGDTEIDVAAVDNQHKRLFLGECKYHAKPVDVAVYSALQEKGQSKELAAAFKSYEVVYGLFSKSGFTDRLVKMAAENSNLILIHEDAVHKK